MFNYIWNLKDLQKVNKNGYKVFSCFACGGGSSMGYKLAGYEVIGDCEIDPKINETYLLNFNPKYNFQMGVQDFYKLNEIPEELYNIDVLDGSPPCSTFSMAGSREKVWNVNKKFREGQQEQVLSDLFFEYIKVAKRLRPKIIVAENVKGMILGNAKGYLNEIIKKFKDLDYQVQLFLLNASEMGVPQQRERIFFICRRNDLKLPPIKLNFNYKPILYKEFKDTEYKPFNKDTELYKLWIKRRITDNNYSDIAQREKGKNSLFGWVFVKDNKVPNTQLASGNRLIRFDKPGFISDKDLITIQSFPQDYNFGSQNKQYICGMSVPPLMIANISKEIEKQLLNKLR